jgi:hypothetical protein
MVVELYSQYEFKQEKLIYIVDRDRYSTSPYRHSNTRDIQIVNCRFFLGKQNDPKEHAILSDERTILIVG